MEKAQAVAGKLEGMKLGKAAGGVREGAGEALGYCAFPAEHCRWVRTNDPLGRLMRGTCRRIRVMRAFPDGQSALILVAARLRYMAGTRWG